MSDRGGISREYVFEEGVVDGGRNGDDTRVVLRGDVDMLAAGRLAPLIDAVCSGHAAKIVIDMSAVEFVDSHGMRLVLDAHRRLTDDGRMLVVVPPSPPVWRSFVLAGLDGVLVVQPDL